ncbi:MAG: cytidylate kinase, partial [Cycloclasticus sp.]
MMGVNDSAPVLTIDGPGGSGKGTVSKIVAKQLGWNYLDSGTVYRALGIAAIDHHVDLSNEKALVKLAENINLEFKFNGDWAVLLDGEEIQQQLQTEEVGNIASKIAVFPTVRQRLLAKQLLFQKPPGLVADGRDMGTVVFP